MTDAFIPTHRLKPVEVTAHRATENQLLTINGKPFVIQPGEWVLTDADGDSWAMEDDHFRRMYEAI